MSVTDPTATARQWLADNPDHEAAPYVRAAFASADRHELLAQETANGKPGGTRVVIVGLEPGRRIVITATGTLDEREIATSVVRYLALLLQGASDRQAMAVLVGVESAQPTDLDDDHVWLLAAPDRKIDTIKALRAVTDLGLAEAKRIVVDGESGYPCCLTDGVHNVGSGLNQRDRHPVRIHTARRQRRELAATLAALGVPHHVGARPPLPGGLAGVGGAK